MGFEGPLNFRGPMEMTLTNQFVEHRRPFFFFFEITSKSEENCSIFLFFFEVHKAGYAQYLSRPWAYVWLSAPLQTTNDISIAFCGK